MKRVLIAGVLAAMGCGHAGAQGLMEVVGNLGSASTANNSTTLTLTKYFAQQFTTGLLTPGDFNQDGNVMHQFLINLNPALGPFDPGYGSEGGEPPIETIYEWTLRGDNAGTPGGSLIGTLNGSVTSPGVATFGYAALVSAGDYFLQSNTTYWLTLRFSNIGPGERIGMYANLPVTTSTATTGAGSLGALQENTGGGWGGLSERMVMQVQVESVPEPGSAGLLILGLGCLRATRRRGGRY